MAFMSLKDNIWLIKMSVSRKTNFSNYKDAADAPRHRSTCRLKEAKLAYSNMLATAPMHAKQYLMQSFCIISWNNMQYANNCVLPLYY